MRETVDVLEKAVKALREVEEHEPIDEYSRSVLLGVRFARQFIMLGMARLRLLIAKEEETCE